MIGMDPCPRCGVPHFITQQHVWLNNGDIVQRGNQISRLVLSESENIDPLFENIEAIIGTPIEHIVITAVRRAVRSYLSPMISEETRRLIRSKKIDLGPIFGSMGDVARAMGLGRVETVDLRYEADDDALAIGRVINPHSLLFSVGSLTAGSETIYGIDMGYSYQEASPGVYEITNFPSPHPEELKKRMWLPPYHHRDGGTELEVCKACGGPAALSAYWWNLDDGIIIYRNTGRRIVMQGPSEMDVVFEALEEELGDTIPEVIVEAERRFTRNNFYSLFDVTTAEEFRSVLALRGLGYLREIEVNRKGLNMRLDNAALPLIIVGMMQGVFEKALKIESTVEWELSKENNLDITIRR